MKEAEMERIGEWIAYVLQDVSAASRQQKVREEVLKLAEAALGKAGITVNKNAIPFDRNPPMVASGIRVGTPAITSRGMGEAEMDRIGEYIARVLASPDDEAALGRVKVEVEALCRKFPLYPEA
jgi:glycine hydroxymethyltransferase